MKFRSFPGRCDIFRKLDIWYPSPLSLSFFLSYTGTIFPLQVLRMKTFPKVSKNGSKCKQVHRGASFLKTRSPRNAGPPRLQGPRNTTPRNAGPPRLQGPRNTTPRIQDLLDPGPKECDPQNTGPPRPQGPSNAAPRKRDLLDPGPKECDFISKTGPGSRSNRNTEIWIPALRPKNGYPPEANAKSAHNSWGLRKTGYKASQFAPV